MGTRSPEEGFDHIAERHLSSSEVTAGTGFGSTRGLRINGRIFAMIMGDALVVKLPGERVTSLIASGSGRPFGSGRGRPMKEWVAVPVDRRDDWADLVDEARGFVGGIQPHQPDR